MSKQTNEINICLRQFPDLDFLCRVWDCVEDEIIFHTFKDILDVLVWLEVFKSRSDAKKNWKHQVNFEPGFNWFERVGKKRLSISVYK